MMLNETLVGYMKQHKHHYHVSSISCLFCRFCSTNIYRIRCDVGRYWSFKIFISIDCSNNVATLLCVPTRRWCWRAKCIEIGWLVVRKVRDVVYLCERALSLEIRSMPKTAPINLCTSYISKPIARWWCAVRSIKALRLQGNKRALLKFKLYMCRARSDGGAHLCESECRRQQIKRKQKSIISI